MIARKLEQKLPLNFTGGLIIDGYSWGSKRYILIIFKDGRVVEYKLWLSSYYKDEELPQDVVDWLTENGFDQMPIYTDSSKFVSRNDYDRILGYDAVGRLEAQMSCVDNQKT